MKKSFAISISCMVLISLLFLGCSSKEEKAETDEKVAQIERVFQESEEEEPVSYGVCRPQEAKAEPVRKKVKDEPVSPNLMWSEPSPGPMYYGYIQDYCKELREGGFSDWRPATPAEIKSTIKECKEFTELPNRNGD